MEMKKNSIVDMTGVSQHFNGCMACSILSGELKPFGGIIYEDDFFTVCQDFEVPINGFIIISTKKHCASINNFTDEEKISFIMLVDRVLKALKSLNIAEEFILVQGERSDIHFHLSLFPRKDWMKEKFGRVISNLKQIQDYAKANLKTKENIEQIAKTCSLLKAELTNK